MQTEEQFQFNVIYDQRLQIWLDIHVGSEAVDIYRKYRNDPQYKGRTFYFLGKGKKIFNLKNFHMLLFSWFFGDQRFHDESL